MIPHKEKIWHMLWYGDLKRLDPYFVWRRHAPQPRFGDMAYGRWHREEEVVREATRNVSAALRRFEYSFSSFAQLLTTSLVTAAAFAATIGAVTRWWTGVLSFLLALAGLMYLWFGWWRGYNEVTRNASDSEAAAIVMGDFTLLADGLSGWILLSLVVATAVGLLATWWAGILAFPLAAVLLKTIQCRGFGWLRTALKESRDSSGRSHDRGTVS